MKVGGIVLCGGRSSRMGRAKAWLPFGDKLMLPRVVRLIRAVVEPIVVVAAPGQDVPPLPEEVRIVRDPEEGRGPLQGLAAGLAAIESSAQAAYLSSCDVPFLKAGFVQRVLDRLGDADICVPKIGDYHHPLAAVYRVNVRSIVQELLDEDRLRPVFLFEKVKTSELTEDDLRDVDPEFASLRNLNTPSDYEQALKDWEKEKEE